MRWWKRPRKTESSAPAVPVAPPLPPAALARQRREAEEAEQFAERARASQEEIARAIRATGYYWPGEAAPVGRFGRDPGLVERIIRALKGE